MVKHKPDCAVNDRPPTGENRHSPACPCPVCLGMCTCGEEDKQKPYVVLRSLETSQRFWTTNEPGSDPTVMENGAVGYEVLAYKATPEECKEYLFGNSYHYVSFKPEPKVEKPLRGYSCAWCQGGHLGIHCPDRVP